MTDHRVTVLDHRHDAVAAAIVELQRAAYRVEADLISYEGMNGLHETEDEVRGLDLSVLGVHDGDLLVGLVGYRIERAVIDIDRLAVAPTHFRRGIAIALLEHIGVIEPDIDRFEVMTGTWNVPAVNLYRSFGFETVETVLSEGCWVTRLRVDAGPSD